jgi:hypothetical protein
LTNEGGFDEIRRRMLGTNRERVSYQRGQGVGRVGLGEPVAGKQLLERMPDRLELEGHRDALSGHHQLHVVVVEIDSLPEQGCRRCDQNAAVDLGKYGLANPRLVTEPWHALGRATTRSASETDQPSMRS